MCEVKEVEYGLPEFNIKRVFINHMPNCPVCQFLLISPSPYAKYKAKITGIVMSPLKSLALKAMQTYQSMNATALTLLHDDEHYSRNSLSNIAQQDAVGL